MKKLNFYGYKGFKVLKTDHSIEANRLHMFCLLNNIPLIKTDNDKLPTIMGASSGCEEILQGLKMRRDIEKDYVPCGSVEWCLELLNRKIKPDYYPEWAEPILHRKVWEGDKWLLQKVFVKPSDKYKRFNGLVTTGTYSKKKKPPFWFSEIVSFENEWRLYVTNGQIKAYGWYSGDEINTPGLHERQLSETQMFIPSSYSGALDIGENSNGVLSLVESQHPFACGWYGEQKDDHRYFQWLIDGWKYMQENSNAR